MSVLAGPATVSVTLAFVGSPEGDGDGDGDGDGVKLAKASSTVL